MPTDDALGLLEWIVLPLAMLLAATFILSRFIGKALELLFASYRERLDAVIRERDHFRDRSERHDDELRALASDLIAELRRHEVFRHGDPRHE